MGPNELLKLARSQIGVKESPAGSNHVKYNTAFYGRAVSGAAYPWCCAFQWWLFRELGASELFCGGKRQASCTALWNWYKARGQTVDVKDARPGDLVLFTFNAQDKKKGIKNHIGLCESNETGHITTIDGNTGTGNEANGGAVMRRRRAWSYVSGVVRPDYPQEEAKPVEKWYEAARKWAMEQGITDGTRPEDKVSRAEVWSMLMRLMEGK